MPSSTMRTAVLQATAIYCCATIYTYHVSLSIFDPIAKNEGIMSLLAALNGLDSTGNMTGNLALDTGNITTHTSLSNRTTAANNATSSKSASGVSSISIRNFYGKQLPMETFTCLLLGALHYKWFIWLEKILPARPRRRIVPEQQAEKIGEGEDREEEVVKKWIAQGRVRRASLNWCNTFLKWILHLTIGNILLFTALHVLQGAFHLEHPKEILKGLTRHLTLSFVGFFLSFTPLAHLMAFIIVPAHNHIVFVASADLLFEVFLTTVVRLFLKWAVETNFVQAMVRNMTDSAIKQHRDAGSGAALGKHHNEL